jgi:hypothetical protein
MTKCFKCGGTDITKGQISRSMKEYFSDLVFAPDGLRFLAATINCGTRLEPDSYACLSCGSVWSQTDPAALKDFMRKHCKQPSNPEAP